MMSIQEIIKLMEEKASSGRHFNLATNQTLSRLKVCYPELYLKATMHIKSLREDLPRFSYVDSYKLTYLDLLNLLNSYVENPDETTSINIWDN